MKKKISTRKLTPIEEQAKQIYEARESFIMLSAFSELVEELCKTDKLIEAMPEGSAKEEQKIKQEEAWDLVMSKELCGKIIIED